MFYAVNWAVPQPGVAMGTAEVLHGEGLGPESHLLFGLFDLEVGYDWYDWYYWYDYNMI